MNRSLFVAMLILLGCACGDDDASAEEAQTTPEAPAEPASPAVDQDADDDPCARALRTERLDFETLTEGQRVADAFAEKGVSFFAGGSEPVIANATGSPASGRVYVAGDHEAVDDNPTEERGNDVPAPPVTFWLHEPGEPDRPAITDVVRMQLVWVNETSVSRVEAYAPDGTRIFQQDYPGAGGEQTQSVCILADDIHRVVARFGPGTPDGPMEDNAGVDVVELGPITPVDR